MDKVLSARVDGSVIKKLVTVYGFTGSGFTENLSAVTSAQAGLNR